ncbi:DUF4956 domain-containing protein [Lachnobacterium bovis]|uniref:Uncharacterized membrane protein YhiD, involved in acid resistance n=1 Tax=Lachnobacterium bovis DSM 14045 TaxID=1122142 RepID=A0A1H3F4J0_9FIRM|nr:DUF4956 domain-containing protein [Lachnobacterium bovis]SDX85835.1 Uncharacterized membrane protein YhiD, involved in acid resistance [Lachnobacterium bovis DSM 14045]
MRHKMLNLLNVSSTHLSTNQIILNFAIATILGLVIYLSYRTSHTRVVYSGRFNVSLLMMTMITTLVMSVIGNNIALSLGMVGALSIVRFRTAIKDPRDTAYIFWCIGIGICCGVSEFLVATIGTGFIFVTLVVFGLVQDNFRYLLVVRCDRNKEKAVLAEVKQFYKGKAELKVNNSTVDKSEFIFELTHKIIKKASSQESNISDRLYDLGGIDSVNTVCQSDEMR